MCGLVLRSGDARPGEVFAQMANRTLIERVAMVWPVQNTLGPVEVNTYSCAGQMLDLRAEVLEQRFDLAPVNIAADRIVKIGPQQVLVFMTHGPEDTPQANATQP